MAFAMVDAAGNGGGAVGGYQIVAGDSECSDAPTTTGITLIVDPDNSPCDTMVLTITGGTAPYAVSL